MFIENVSKEILQLKKKFNKSLDNCSNAPKGLPFQNASSNHKRLFRWMNARTNCWVSVQVNVPGSGSGDPGQFAQAR